MSSRISTIIYVSLALAIVMPVQASPHRSNALGDYLRARADAQPLIPPDQLDAAENNPSQFTAHNIEETGTINGFLDAGSGRVALVTVGSDSLSVDLPASLRDAPWIIQGASIRMLLAIEPPTDQTLTGRPVLVMAAPEFDVAQSDQEAAAQAAAEQKALAERPATVRTTLASRYMAHMRNGMDPSISLTGGHPSLALSPQARAVFGAYRDTIRGLNGDLTDDQVDKITSSILYYSDLNRVDPRLIVAMIIAESGFDVNSTSHTGAMGLGQLMPATAREMGISDPYDPQQNIAGAVRILRGHLDNYGGAPSDAGVIPFNQIALTMAAYNAGPGAVRRYHGVPPYRETQRYVARVAALYKKMCGTGS